MIISATSRLINHQHNNNLSYINDIILKDHNPFFYSEMLTQINKNKMEWKHSKIKKSHTNAQAKQSFFLLQYLSEIK